MPEETPDLLARLDAKTYLADPEIDEAIDRIRHLEGEVERLRDQRPKSD